MIHSFLLIGQSNMAGRGFLSEAEPLDTKDGRLRVLRNGRWQKMFRPVNPDRSFSGSCLAESFAQCYADDHPDISVGVIPCADGGTSLDQWQEGSLLFDHAVYSAQLAMRTSELVGILWHQGEGDCTPELYPFYFEKITAIMAALRRKLGDETLPIVVGGLGDFLKDCSNYPNLRNYSFVNDELIRFAEQTPYVAFASAEGLGSNPDKLHFHHRALQEFGQRYYEAFRTVEAKECAVREKEKIDDERRTEMELL